MRKVKSLSIRKADAAEDIELINQYSVRELTPDEVYCFSVVLCDNDIDRDNERFTDETLDQLAELFVGKTGISDHVWSAGNQVARLYRAAVQETAKKNRLGEPLKQLVGSAYMLRTEHTQPLVDAIEGGIVKEVSVGCAVKKVECSICGTALSVFLIILPQIGRKFNFQSEKYQLFNRKNVSHLILLLITSPLPG